MTPLEFKHALEMGFGRAIQHLKNHDPAPYEDVILEACLTFGGVNFQSEGGREQYFYEVIQHSSNPSSIKSGLLEALLHLGEDGESNQQIVDLCILFAKEGFPSAKEAIIRCFLSDPEERNRYGDPCSEAILELDGIDGFYRVLDTLGQLAIQDKDFIPSDQLIDFAQRLFGQETVENYRSQWAGKPTIDAYSQAENKCEERYRKAREKSKNAVLPEQWTFEQLYTWIKRQPVFYGAYLPRRWAKSATVFDIDKAVQALENAKDSLEIQGLLSIFMECPFPKRPQLIIELAQHPDLEVVQWALSVLYKISHPDVRDFAFKYQANYPDHPQLALGFFIKNYREGDHEFIENALLTEIPDKHDFEDVSKNVVDVFTANITPNALKSLVLVYEKNRCIRCRQNILKLLEQLQILPQSILEECVFDASLEIREWAKETLKARALA